jgi:hypothetical protein
MSLILNVRPQMQPWSPAETYSLVGTIFGRDQEMLARASVRSVQVRQAFAAYHFHESLRLHKAFERKHLAGKALLHIRTQQGVSARKAFEVLMIKAGANALAAIQCVHAIPDTLAHAIYFAMGQNLSAKPLSDRDISTPKVSGLLKKTPTLEKLGLLLQQSQSGPGWAHLAAVCNTSKHRSIVRSSLSEDWTGTRNNFRELHVDSFQREGALYPSLSLESLVGGEFDRLAVMVVETGHEINAQLRAIAA